LYKSVIQGNCTYYGAKELSEIVKNKGESFSFGIEEGQIKEFLVEKGFTPIYHYSPQEFEEKYLYDNTEDFFGRMYGFAGHVYAKVS